MKRKEKFAPYLARCPLELLRAANGESKRTMAIRIGISVPAYNSLITGETRDPHRLTLSQVRIVLGNSSFAEWIADRANVEVEK